MMFLRVWNTAISLFFPGKLCYINYSKYIHFALKFIKLFGTIIIVYVMMIYNNKQFTRPECARRKKKISIGNICHFSNKTHIYRKSKIVVFVFEINTNHWSMNFPPKCNKEIYNTEFIFGILFRIVFIDLLTRTYLGIKILNARRGRLLSILKLTLTVSLRLQSNPKST